MSEPHVYGNLEDFKEEKHEVWLFEDLKHGERVEGLYELEPGDLFYMDGQFLIARGEPFYDSDSYGWGIIAEVENG